MKKKIEKILEDTLQLYGEFYGQSCYFAGEDKKKELPKDEFLEIYKKKALEKIIKLLNEKNMKITKKNRKLTYKERIRWFIQNYYETGMEYGILLDTMKNEDLDNFKWYDDIIKIPKYVSEMSKEEWQLIKNAL